ncbi:MAG: methyl-accepting chemotaxis protein [Myxococcaceae bacterium]
MNSSETLSQLVGQTLTGVAEDLAAARLAVRNGVARLTGNFYEFRDRLKLQGEELQAVARTLEGDKERGDAGFIQDMNDIVTRFVDDLVMVSASSVRLVQRVDEMGTDIEQVMRNLERIESLASETRFIALNARIEAHRAGDVGMTFRVVADEVKSLADDATSFSAQIRDLVERTQGRLFESRLTVGKLASHDMNGALEAQRQVLHALEQLGATNSRVSGSLVEVEKQVTETVRALQFEDMVTQLLDAASRRLEAVRSLWLEWVAHAPATAERASAVSPTRIAPTPDDPTPAERTTT